MLKTLTSAFSASRTAPGTGSGQNSSGEKLQSTRFTNGRLISGQTYRNTEVEHLVHRSMKCMIGRSDEALADG